MGVEPKLQSQDTFIRAQSHRTERRAYRQTVAGDLLAFQPLLTRLTSDDVIRDEAPIDSLLLCKITVLSVGKQPHRMKPRGVTPREICDDCRK